MRRVRDSDRPMGQRVTALHSLVANHHSPLGFLGTRTRLRKAAGVGLLRRWTEPRLLEALRVLEESRASHLRYRTAFAQRRRQEKAEGRRRPTKGDVAALDRAEWLKDVEEAGSRHPPVRLVVESICRVCGYNDGDHRFNGLGHPEYVICPCCGSESGVDDSDLDQVRRTRAKWVEAGCSWWSPNDEEPTAWKPGLWRDRVPERWR